MKSILLNTRIAGIILLAIQTFPAASSPYATSNGKEKNRPPIELKYMGTVNQHFVFDLVLTDTGESEFMLTIRDESGTVWYRDKVKGGNSTKRFSVNMEEMGEIPLRFEITNRKKDQTVVFQVDKTLRTVEEFAISRVR